MGTHPIDGGVVICPNSRGTAVRYSLPGNAYHFLLYNSISVYTSRGQAGFVRRPLQNHAAVRLFLWGRFFLLFF